jgi:hypothetical protein
MTAELKIEQTDEGKYIVMFQGGMYWQQLGDEVFDTLEQAEAFRDDQLANADYDEEE